MEIDIHQLDRPYAGLRIRDPRHSARWLASLSQGDPDDSLAAVLVTPAKAPDRFVLIDGYARVSALEQLGRDTTPAIVLPMRASEALVFALQLETQGRRCALEEGWLLQQVQQETGLALAALAQRFGRSLSWVSRRLGLVEALPESVQQQVRCGAIPSRAALRSLLPLARANDAQCCELVTGIAGAELSVRAIERLYVAWREGDEAQRARITSHPLLFLRAEQEARQCPDPADSASSSAVEATLKDIDVAGAICRRVRRRLIRGLTPNAEAKATFLRAWQETRLAFEALGEQLEGLAGGAGDAR
jgi:ParB-like chromosome segregation protein Spo0J